MSMGFTNNTIQEDCGNPWSESSENSNGSSRSSSTQSWIDDSEQSVARELKEQYDKFEEALYLERSPGELSKSLQAEVKIWSEHSPHIRVRGVKATLHERPDTLFEEAYDSNYEEIIESHGSLEESLEKSLSFSDDVKQFIETCPMDEQEIIKTDLKNAIVHKLFDHAMPRVLEKFEPVIKSVSAGRRMPVINSINKSEAYLNSLINQQNQRLTASSNSRRSYMNDVKSRKPMPLDDSREYQPVLSSRGLRRRGCDLIPEQPLSGCTRDNSSHLEVPKAKINRASNLSTHRSAGKPNVNSKTKKCKYIKSIESEKTILLPAIEAMPIAPKIPDQRSVSAMVRFTKTLPRVGPNTARYRDGAPSSAKPSDYDEDKKLDKLQRDNEKSSFASELQVVGTRSATSLKTNRWRY